MNGLTNFLLAFGFSFIGSIPPGTINLTVIQLGLESRLRTAIRFSIAASLVEYPYAWIAVKFESVITSTPFILQNIHLIGAIIMIVIGMVNLWPASKTPSINKEKFNQSGYGRGLVLGLLNPLAIPYWIAITAYLKSQRWIDTSSPYQLHLYLLGVVGGALLLLVVFAYLGKKIISAFTLHPFIQRIPGITLITLGVYALLRYFVSYD